MLGPNVLISASYEVAVIMRWLQSFLLSHIGSFLFILALCLAKSGHPTLVLFLISFSPFLYCKKIPGLDKCILLSVRYLFNFLCLAFILYVSTFVF